MGFKRKQMLGFGLILLFLAILLSFMMFTLNNLKSSMTEIVENRYEKVQASMEIRQLFSRSDREILFAADDANKEERANSLEIIKENHSLIESQIAELSGTLNKVKAKQLLKEFETQYTSYSITETEIIQNIQEENSSENISRLMRDQREKRTKVISAMDDFKDYQEGVMKETLRNSKQTYEDMISFTIFAVILSILVISVTMVWMIRSTSKDLQSITKVIKNIDFKNLSVVPRISVRTKDEIGDIARSFNDMAESLEAYNQKEKDFNEKISEQNWIQTRVADIATMYQRIVDVEVLADRFITRLAPMMGASIGAIYVRRGEGKDMRFVKLSSFAGDGEDAGRREFRLGEGLIGQCAQEGKSKFIDNIPEDFHLVTTGLGEVNPKSIVIAPVVFEDEVVAMVELASLEAFTKLQKSFLTRVLDTLGITINNVEGRMEIERLLKESQAQTEELQAQSEELQSQSEEMQAQSEELQTQAEELRMINERLEERNRETEDKSKELQVAKLNLEKQAEELKLSSKYKSEFMANMSHELRTPLNSILILSEMLSDPNDSKLNEEQQEFARVINSSGQDLLTLINDILDLSKVEVGKLEVVFDEMNMSELPELLHRNFDHVAKKKNIDFLINKDKNVPDIFFTDEQRFQQILKNLLSNAFKFTEKGSVSVQIKKADEENVAQWIQTKGASNWIEINVADTGIGISKEKQKLIFEAFQQGDGATMRKYGGTGLGLSICREFAKLLGGWVIVDSKEGRGSTFTFFIPSMPEGFKHVGEAIAASPEVAAATHEATESFVEQEEQDVVIFDGDGKKNGNPFCNKTVLVVDDDHRNIFALKNALKHEGMEILTAENGYECLELLEKGNNIDAILMDIMMPGMDGYETMTRIREQNKFENLPIIALTAKAMKGDRAKCLKAGASDYVSKPLKLDQLLSVLRVWLTN
ncbi:hybrid sensor histidine kinase/response regulator [Peribacillus butanolivorans]|uniref:Circadian input-output histidine kinase CikA n=2 Tax=Peribacillus butanolivorans TaxID=421767 RepID=A0AAX0S153_9BACI|nr:hybrid sensor histidine kinase/response regulator [Peribacillus butanolivorans]